MTVFSLFSMSLSVDRRTAQFQRDPVLLGKNCVKVYTRADFQIIKIMHTLIIIINIGRGREAGKGDHRPISGDDNASEGADQLRLSEPHTSWPRWKVA